MVSVNIYRHHVHVIKHKYKINFQSVDIFM